MTKPIVSLYFHILLLSCFLLYYVHWKLQYQDKILVYVFYFINLLEYYKHFGVSDNMMHSLVCI